MDECEAMARVALTSILCVERGGVGLATLVPLVGALAASVTPRMLKDWNDTGEGKAHPADRCPFRLRGLVLKLPCPRDIARVPRARRRAVTVGGPDTERDL